MKRLNRETRKLDLLSSAQLRSPAVQITVAAPNIHLSTSTDSVLVVRVAADSGALAEVFSDEVSRNGFHHTALAPDLLLATDKQYGVTGLWLPPGARALASLHTVFEGELASSVSRIRRGVCRPPWVPHARRVPGVVGADCVLAAGVDGSFWQLRVVDAAALRLLAALGAALGRRGVGRAGFVDGDLMRGAVADGASLRARVRTIGAEDEFVAAAVAVVGAGDGDVWEEVVAWLESLLEDAVL